MLRHPKFSTVRRVLRNAKPGDFPKVQKALKILGGHLRKHARGKVMVFTEYRSTVNLLNRELSQELMVEPEILIGQAKSEGMTQKEQKRTLERFEDGEFNTLISTRIGEEGIDVPTTSLVLFYEPIPSAVRRIQRKGRTARDGRSGKVKILVMKGTRDEPYYWKGVKGERKIYKEARKLGTAFQEEEKDKTTKFSRGQSLDVFARSK
ncbi:hypothetical protein AKJ65_02155 [candidate division MSBL1 archaeon SCGC-AAA259E19]|uniref:Helicase C-terminal domain-containing protein n=1 Tax=candidate division MSBL1 archaeon SCGC-AAA259E19 TaxID=1698264 RepID=A0A133UMA0_9EURY|nr:hypothetical protein AKJ65_02155 [candidate division MSBL1 archaeon SCGC-AAA259E19]